MFLWIAFAIAAAVVIAALARPMLAERTEAATAREADLAVYRDQLGEIDADKDRGLIDEAEAQSARTELARRILKRAEAPDIGASEPPPAAGWPAPVHIAYATALAVPLLALAVYLSLGSPWMPGMPHSARMQTTPGQASVNELVARVEAQLRKTPDDGRGWDVLAPVYLRLRRFDDAARAFGQAIRLEGETSHRLMGFAEATVLANNGIVVEPARLAYARVLELEPKSHEARFWIAMADEQEGKLDAAAEGYRSILKDAPQDAPWKGVVEARLNRIAEPGGAGPAEASAKTESQEPIGPTAEDVAAAQSLSNEQRQDFINSMVARLAAKLEKNPDDIEGWLRLVRAYVVLGRRDDAARALADARKAADDDSEKKARLDALASELGLKT